VLLLGAGGSSLAMTMYFTQEKFRGNMPKRITIANRSTPRLESAKTALAERMKETEIRFVHGPQPADNDALIAKLPPYSLVVNATGLGKDAPGTPTTDAVSYPENTLVWEINYRGATKMEDLIFREQALKQEKAKHLHVEDGWNYFIYGWTQVIAEVFHRELGPDKIAELSRIAK
jgi:shikimate 5-dehydrogenase